MKAAVIISLCALVAMVAIVLVDVVKPEVAQPDAAADSSGAAPASESSLLKMLGLWHQGTGKRATDKGRAVTSEHASEETAAHGVVRARDSIASQERGANSEPETETTRNAARSGGAFILHGSAQGASAKPSEATPGAAHGSIGTTGNGTANSNSQTGSTGNQHGTTTSKSTAPTTAKTAADKPTDSCGRCESMPHDDNMSCPDSYTNCRSLPGTLSMDHKVMPGMSKAQLCVQILDCMHQTKCAAVNASGGPASTDCLCGRDVDPDKCFKGMTISQTQGSCRDLMVAGTEVEDLEQIAMRFFDPSSATGAAVAVVETCDIFHCAKECL